MLIEYGKTLRMIRKHKGITLKKLAEGIGSVSFLSKFEGGESDIRLGLMTRILDKIMMNFDEFLYVHHDIHPSELDRFFKATQTAYLNRDAKQLIQFKNEQLKKWKQYDVETYLCNALLIEVYESIVDTEYKYDGFKEEEIRVLSDYLFRVEVWGYYELMLYNGTLLLLEPEMVIMLSRTAYEKSSRFREYKKVNDAITTVLFNTIIYLLGSVNQFHESFKYEQEVSEFFSYLEAITIPESSLVERVDLLQLKGAYEIRNGKKDEGTAKMKHAIQILRDLKANRLATNIEQYLKQIVENIE